MAGRHLLSESCPAFEVGLQTPQISARFDRLGFDGRPARLGIMGGTFDPIHIGHLACADQVREAFDLDGVLFIPAGNPVFKKDRRLASARDRLTMCALAVRDNPSFDVSDIEITRQGDTFTVDTLHQFREHYPDNVEFFFILGADTAATLMRWKNSYEIASLATIIIVTRPGYEVDDNLKSTLVEQGGFRMEFLHVTELMVSSSALRMRAAAGKSIRYLTTDNVAAYVKRHHLYDYRDHTTDGNRNE